MNNNAWFIKEKPLLSLQSMGGGASGTLMQGAADKTYVDDVFSTYLYAETGTTVTVNNSVDMSEGGMVWFKNREATDSHALIDTARGGTKVIHSDTNAAESTQSGAITSFNTNGFEIGNYGAINGGSNKDVASWTFAKQEGFFDVVTYTGNDTNRTISHSLGCVPGFMMIKRLDDFGHWRCYHKDLGPTKHILLSSNGPEVSGSNSWNNTAPTASVFSLGTATELNNNGSTYVAYLFAGGASTAATAPSVDFDGSSDYLSIADNSDFALGSGDFTFEAWIKYDALNANGAGWLTDWATAAGGLGWYFGTAATGGGSNRFVFGWSDTGSNINTIDSGHTVKADGHFHHYSVTRSGTTLYFFVDGNLIKTNAGVTESFYNPSGAIAIGQNPDVGGSAWLLNGKISNLRLIKGTCLYTTSFRPPTKPLTSITNTVLLCCNNSSVTGSTITPSTITAVGSPTASTDSPFDDSEGFKFGEGGDQNTIKTGKYVGNASSNGPEVFLGWEPQWILIKNTLSSQDWMLFDSMRGISTGYDDAWLEPNTSDAEDVHNFIDLTPTGFRVVSSSALVNGSADPMIYIAIRRPDGYVGKPAEAGTDVFAMDTGSNNFPAFDSNFPVDFVLQKAPDVGANWLVPSRLTGSANYLKTNSTSAEASWNVFDMDSNVGWGAASTWASATNDAWMWKRHAGFDVVNYVGNQTMGHQIPHSLGQPPEMVWTKNRDQIQQWSAGHKGLNGGTNPWNWVLVLSDAEAEQEATNFWEAPTATHFTVGSDARVNRNNDNYLAILFSSVEGISKVGSYTGSSSALTITTGFQPRFVIIKNVVDTGYNWTTGWFTFDTMRGWASGNNDKRMRLNDNAAQTTEDWTDPTSTGFTINANSGNPVSYTHLTLPTKA